VGWPHPAPCQAPLCGCRLGLPFWITAGVVGDSRAGWVWRRMDYGSDGCGGLVLICLDLSHRCNPWSMDWASHGSRRAGRRWRSSCSHGNLGSAVDQILEREGLRMRRMRRIKTALSCVPMRILLIRSPWLYFSRCSSASLRMRSSICRWSAPRLSCNCFSSARNRSN
jgi:hypothetical protein